MKKFFSISIIIILLITFLPAEDLNVTVYNNNIGLVSEVRKVDLDKGRFKFQIKNIPPGIKVNTVFLNFLGSKKPDILEMNYNYDLTSPQNLLDQFKGKKIFYRLSAETKKQGLLIGTSQGKLMIRSNGGNIKMIPIKKIISFEFDDPSQEIKQEPTLSYLVKSYTGQTKKAEVNYITKGLDWSAEYNMILAEDDTTCEISGWGTVKNNSGMGFHNVDLSLIAGKIEKKQPRRRMALVAAQKNAEVKQEKIFNYHQYKIQRTLNLPDDSKKQLALFNNVKAKIEKKYVFKTSAYSEDESNLDINLGIKNNKKNNLGIPFPAGQARLYKKDSNGKLKIIGRDKISHTGKQEKLNLTLGKAFDIRGEKVILEKNKREEQTTVEVKFTMVNDSKESASIEIREMHHGDWYVKNSNQEYHKKSNSLLLIPLTLEANQTKEIKYSFVREH